MARGMAFTTSINKVQTHDMSHTNTITPLSVAVYQPDDMGTYTVMDESSANNIFDSFNNNYEDDLDEGIFENIAIMGGDAKRALSRVQKNRSDLYCT